MFASHLYFRRLNTRLKDTRKRRTRLTLEHLEGREVPATFGVTSTSDALTPGTFRFALTQANATSGPDTITFAIPGSGVQTITPLSALPIITEAVTIDGRTQPGFIDTPLIELAGTSAGVGVDGLWINSSGSSVRSLVINRFRRDPNDASLNHGAGIYIVGNNNVVYGSYIGTNAAGTAAAANGLDGVKIVSGTGNVVGGTGANEGNLLSGNFFQGVFDGGAATSIIGNRIGTNGAGTAAVANTDSGVYSFGSGVVYRQNVISGNSRHGIYRAGGAATNGTIAGNVIGLNAAGTVAVGNGLDGVLIFNGPTGNTIGGPAAADRNLIGGNAVNGIRVTGAGTAGNRIVGNRIGTNAAGTAALGNGQTGVQVAAGAAGTVIGTDGNGVGDAVEGNLISGNVGSGLLVTGSNTTGTVVAGNRIGTDAAGTAKLGNLGHGVFVNGGAVNTVIGTDGDGSAGDAAEGNLISGNGVNQVNHGVYVTGTGTRFTRIAGNRIGTTADGTARLANVINGVRVDGGASDTVIGTNLDGKGDAAEGNLLAGGPVAIIEINGSGTDRNRVSGNLIGLNAAGTALIGPVVPVSSVGVLVTNGASNNMIGGRGGVGPGLPGNVIAGVAIGIGLNGNTGGGNNTIQSNYIGTDRTGTVALADPEYLHGITGMSAGTLIGGRIVGSGTLTEGNVIAGTAREGIFTTGLGGSVGYTIQGNFIGTDATGTKALGNREGIRIDSTSAPVLVGSDDPLFRNVISGNRATGVAISSNYAGPSRENTSILGNYIGVDVTGSVALGNAGQGVSVAGVSHLVRGNVISSNTLAGVEVVGSTTTNVRVQGNRIGTTVAGNAARGNRTGVFVGFATNGVVIGTDGDGLNDAAEANLISGNSGLGLHVTNGAVGTRIAGNRIGTTADGNGSLGNSQTGVLVEGGATGTVIGTDGDGAGDDLEGNLISANGLTASFLFGQTAGGIFIRGSTTTTTVVAGNRVGTNAAGTASLGNGLSGVIVQDASNTRIGTDGNGSGDLAERNILSGNGAPERNGAGVDVSRATNVVIAGNFIGTNAGGTAALANTGGGIVIREGTTNAIIGTNGDGIGDAVEGNQIVGGLGSGIVITGDGSGSTRDVRIAGNLIGNDGTVALGPTVGVGVFAAGGSKNVIIGTNGDGVSDALEGNVISGNVNGVLAGGVTGLRIAGNRIGTNAAGTAAIPNTAEGVRFGGIGVAQTGAIIGTDGDGVSDDLEGNVISGNATVGVSLEDATGNRIAGNRIGTNAAGTAAVANGGGGIQFFPRSSSNLVGTNGDGVSDGLEGNLISGNNSTGVGLSFASNANRIAGNRIGTDATGTTALPNKGNGIQIAFSSGNVVGTNGDGVGDAAEGNVISGNGVNGVIINSIAFTGSSFDNVVAGNRIGTNAAGTAAIGNLQAGVLILGTATDVTQNTRIGTNGDGVSDGLEGNLISGNGGRGVSIEGAGAVNTRVAGNRIGTNASGTAGLSNAIGVRVEGQAPGTIIGTDGNGVGDAAEGNQIAGNGVTPIGGINGDVRLNGTLNTIIAGNLIGLNAAGTASLAVFGAGIQVTGSTGVRIGTNGDGTSDTLERNTIVGSIVRISDTDNRGGPGVQIDGGSANTVVAGNHVSVNKAGTAALPGNNNTGGILIAGNVSGTVIGTNGDGVGDAVEGNLIDSGVSYGILITDQTATAGTTTRIAGNRIGTDGTVALGPDAGVGIFVSRAAALIIGTNGDGISDALEGNVISGGGGGIDAAQTTGLRIAGNFIGTNAAGTAVIGNLGSGVELDLGQTNAIVGTNGDGVSDDLERNVISGNAYGVDIDGAFQSTIFNTGNRVAGNRIGTNLAGTAALPNRNGGILIERGAGTALIGTNGDGVSDALEANLISGNVGTGVQLFQAAAGNRIAGNIIGTNLAGTAKLANTGLGVAISITAGAIVGTNGDGVGDAVEGNLIAGNAAGGVGINDGDFGVASDGHRVAGNRIGTATLGNGGFGVAVSAFGGFARNNVIGTNGDGVGDAFEGNVIVGNASGGVQVSGPTTNSTVVAGNQITSNNGDGVVINGAPSARVGTNGDGTGDAAEGNLISGNVGRGVFVTGAAAATVIAGNFIGTTATGSAAFANAGGAVFVSGAATNTRIGTDGNGVADAAERNVIGGSGTIVTVTGSGTSGTVFAGNYVGVNAAGTASLGNFGKGIDVRDGATNTRIGTDGSNDVFNANERNVFSGIGIDGIVVTNTTNAVVAGNFVGTTADGAGKLGNGGTGIAILEGSTNVRVGTDGNGVFDDLEANLVANNGQDGVFVDGGSFKTAANVLVAGNRIEANADNGVEVGFRTQAVRVERNAIVGNGGGIRSAPIPPSTAFGNVFSQNRIVGNARLGIDLGNAGRNPPGPVTTTIPNRGINSPELVGVFTSAGTTKLTANFAGRPNRAYRFEFFANDVNNPMTTQADVFLGFVDVTTTAAGTATPQLTFANGLLPTAAYQFFTATATDLDPTDPDGTSELGTQGAFVPAALLDVGIPPIEENTIAILKDASALQFTVGSNDPNDIYAFTITTTAGSLSVDAAAAAAFGVNVSQTGSLVQLGGTSTAINDFLLSSGVRFAPPAFFSGIGLVRYQVTDSRGVTATAEATIDVLPVAAEPLVSVASPAFGQAGVPIPVSIGIDLIDRDGSETVPVVNVRGIAPGVTFNRGNLSADGTFWELPADQLAGLTVTVPVGGPGLLELTVQTFAVDRATLTFGEETKVSSDVLRPLRIDTRTAPVVELFDGASSFEAPPGNNVIFLPAALSDPTGASTAGYAYTVRVDRGTIFVDPVFVETLGLTAAGSGSDRVTLRGDLRVIEDYVFNNLLTYPPNGYSGEVRLTAELTAPDGRRGFDSTILRARPVATVPALSVLHAVRGNPGEVVPLAIVVQETLDRDGSETLAVLVTGVPDGATLSAGTNLGSGAWQLTRPQLDGLTIRLPVVPPPPPGETLSPPVTFALTVRARIEDAATFPLLGLPPETAVATRQAVTTLEVVFAAPLVRPTVSAPATFDADEDGSALFRRVVLSNGTVLDRSFQIADPDFASKPNGTYTVFVRGGRGRLDPLAFSAGVPAGVTIAGAGTPVLTLTGTLPALNELLKVGVSNFIGDNYSGESVVTVDVIDPDGLGGGNATRVRFLPDPDVPDCVYIPPFVRTAVNAPVPIGFLVPPTPDTDGSETIYAVFELPSGSALSAGVFDPATNTWRVEFADIPGLTFNPPLDFDGQLSVLATVFVEDRAAFPSFPAPNDKAVNVGSASFFTQVTVATPDYPRLGGPARLTIFENGVTPSAAAFVGPAAVTLAVPTAVGGETATLTLRIADDFDGPLGTFAVRPGNPAAALATGDGTGVLTITGSQSQLAAFLAGGFDVVPRPFFSGEVAVRAEAVNSAFQFDFADYIVRVRPVASPPELTVAGGSSVEVELPGGVFTVSPGFLAATPFPDQDGSEFGSLQFEIAGVADPSLFAVTSALGSILPSSPGFWFTFGTVNPADLQAVLDSITVTAPPGFVGRAEFVVTQFISDFAHYETECVEENPFLTASVTVGLNFLGDLGVNAATAFGTEGLPTDLANVLDLIDPAAAPGHVHLLELSTGSGTIRVNPAFLPPGVSVAGSNTSSVLLIGSLPEIQAALDTFGAIAFVADDPTFAGATFIAVTFANTSTPTAQVFASLGVVIDPVASTLTADADSFTVQRGETAPVRIALPPSADADGSETVTVFIDDVFGSFNQGTNLGGGRWQFSPAELAGLVFFPAVEGSFTFVVTVQVTDTVSLFPVVPGTSENVSQTVTSFDVTVIPDVTFDGGTVAENSPEGTVVGKLTAESLVGARLTPGALYTFSLVSSTGYDFTVDPDGTIRVGTENPDFEDAARRNFSMTFLMERTFAGLTEPVFTVTVPIFVANFAELPTVIGPDPIFSVEDTTSVITGLSFTAPEAVGNVFVTLSTNGGTGSLRVNATSPTVTILDNGISSITLIGGVDAINALLAVPGALTYRPRQHYAGVSTFLPIIADLVNDLPPPPFISFPTLPVADPVPAPFAADAGGPAGTAIPLNILPPALADTDGSETLNVLIGGLPVGASLSAGSALGGGVWRLSQAELVGLTLTPPPGFAGTILLSAQSEVVDFVVTDFGPPAFTTAEDQFVSPGRPFEVTVFSATGVTLALAGGAVAENSPTGSVAGIVIANGGVAGETFAFVLVAATGYDFTLDADGTVRVGTQSPNFELLSAGTITVRATGSFGTTQLQTFPVGVTNVNEAPAVGGVSVLDPTEDAAVTLGLTVTDPDAGGEPVRVTLRVTNGALSLRPDPLVVIDGNGTDSLTVTGPLAVLNALFLAAGGSLTYTPAADYSGPDEFAIFVDDLGNAGTGGPLAGTATRPFAVVAVADAPSLAVVDAVGEEGSAIPLAVGGASRDADGSEVVSFRIVGLPAGYTLTAGVQDAATGDWLLTRADLANLRVTAPQDSDGGAIPLSVVATAVEPSNGSVAETVLPLGLTVRNVAPALSGLTVPTTATAGELVTVDLGRFADPGQEAIWTVRVVWGDGTSDVVERTRVGPIGTIAHRYAAAGTFTVRVEVFDGTDTGSQETTLGVQLPPPPPVNLAPVPRDDAARTSFETPVVIDVLANDADPEGNPLSILSVSPPANGTAGVVNGQVRYVPAAGFAGTDTFAYTVGDGHGNEVTATVVVTVEPAPPPANRPPVATDDAVQTAFETPVVLDLLAGDTDPDGHPLAVIVTTRPANGTLTQTDAGLVYTPDLGFAGTDSFEYTVSDGHGGTATALASVLVEAAPPVTPPPVSPAGPSLPPVATVPPSVSPPVLTPPIPSVVPTETMLDPVLSTLTGGGGTSTRPPAAGPTERIAEVAAPTIGPGGAATPGNFTAAGEIGGSGGPVNAGFLVVEFNDPSQPVQTPGRLTLEASPASSGSGLGAAGSFGLATYQPDRPPSTVLPLDPTAPTAGFGESEGENLQLIDQLYRDFAPVPSATNAAPPPMPVGEVAPPANAPAKADVRGAVPDPRRGGIGLAEVVLLGAAAVAVAPLADRWPTRTDTRPRFALRHSDEEES
jgi:hypothetical protein